MSLRWFFRAIEMTLFVGLFGLWVVWGLQRQNPILAWNFPLATYSDGVLTIQPGIMEVAESARNCQFKTDNRVVADMGQVDIDRPQEWRTSRVGVFSVTEIRMDVNLDRALRERGQLLITHRWQCNPLQRLLGWDIVAMNQPIPIVRQ